MLLIFVSLYALVLRDMILVVILLIPDRVRHTYIYQLVTLLLLLHKISDQHNQRI